MKQILKQINLTLLLTLALTGTAQGSQSFDQSEISWFSSRTSTLLNLSSIELAKNHVDRGILFATEALEKKLNPMDELVANHNLCVAYLASERSELSAHHCARAFELAQGPFSVLRIRGAYQLQESELNNENQIILSPVQMIIRNIQLQYPEIRLALLMKD